MLRNVRDSRIEFSANRLVIIFRRFLFGERVYF